MRKCLTILFVAACALLLARGSHAQDRTNGILFLHLRRSAEGVNLVGAESHRGSLKPEPNREALEFDVVDSENFLLHQGSIADPLVERLEFADPADPGRLRGRRLEHDSAEFTIRVPAFSAGGAIRFFQRTPPAELGAQSARRFISELQIPEEARTLRSSSAAAKFSTLLTNGPTSQRINIVILAEAYTAAQESAFTNQARSVLSRILNTSPYSAYRNHFNAFAIFVPSQQAGSDHPEQQIFRNTYFNSSYGKDDLVRLITIPPDQWNSSYSAGRGKVFALLSEFVPEYDIALLLVNDMEYGGSGGVPAIASINSASAELALHEIGHSFAGLQDEYEDNVAGFPDVEAANTTRETRRSSIKWRNWINPLTPVPTPETATYQSVVGLFEGAYFHQTDWYRPRLDCRMRNLSVPFCEVCRETHILQTYSRLSIIPDSSPASNNVTVPGGGELVLKVDTIQPAQAPLAFTWTIDGVTNTLFRSNSFSASYDTLGVGTHLVRVNVADETPLVRTDPLGKLLKSRSWLVQVAAATNVAPSISDIPDATVPHSLTLTVPFIISDPDTPIDELLVTATSSETNVIPNQSISHSGTGTNRTISLTPTPNMSGVTTITVTVDDGSTSSAITFHVIVTTPLPVLVLQPIPDQRAFSGPLTIPLSIFADGVGDPALSASSSNPLLVPASGIHFQLEGAQHSVVLTPIQDGAGDSRITVTATDGVSMVQQSFTVTFLARPVITATTPQMTGGGILFRFTSDLPAAMILELSTDLRFWTPVSSAANASELEYLAPNSSVNARGFYRLRLVPL